MKKTLEKYVLEYQSTVAKADRCEDSCSDLYSAIHKACKGIASKAIAMCPDIDEFVDEKLQGCLQSFSLDGGPYFKAMFRKALTNKIVDIHRKHERMHKIASVISADGETHDISNTIVDNREKSPEVGLASIEEYELYGKRKRAVLDNLKLNPPNKMSTLLLDQRQRVACRYAPTDRDGVAVGRTSSAWTMQTEIWNTEDEKRQLAEREPFIRLIWDAFARIADDEQATSQTEMVRAISENGCEIPGTTWRKRISRYLKDVRDQVDDETYGFFHSNL